MKETSDLCNNSRLSRMIATVLTAMVATGVAMGGDIGITRCGAGVSQWDNSIVVGDATSSKWSMDGGFVIDPSYLSSGTQATYRFLIPDPQLCGSMTNLQVRVYGKGADWRGEPALYAGSGSGRILLASSLPETESKHGPYTIPLSCLSEAEGTIPGYWLDITLKFNWNAYGADWYDVKYVQVEYSFSGVEQNALENYQSILNATQTLWTFYDEVAYKDDMIWPHPVYSTDGMEATCMAVIPSYKSVFAAGDPLASAILEILKLPKLYQGMKSTFEEYFAFTDFMQRCTVFFNTGSGNEASFAFNEMAELAEVWKNTLSNNGQIDSDEISGINAAIANAIQRINSLELKIMAIGQDMKNILNTNGEGIRNCAKSALLLLSPMVEFDCESGDKLDGGYLHPLQDFLESIRPVQFGTLTVTLSPSSAQWRLTSGPDTNWKSSGVTVPNISTGDYTLEFSSVPGYATPSPRQITINAGTNTQTVNYQQSGGVTLTPWYDTYVNQQYETAKYYSAESLWINNTTNQKYTFIGFDLDGIPLGSTINKAELHLQFLCTNSSVIDMYKITDNVSGGNNDSITWNNQPDLGFHYGTFALGASPSSGDTREWIITCTSAIQMQVNSNEDWEFCMKINDLNSDVSFNIISSEWSFDVTPGPYLYVEYTSPSNHAPISGNPAPGNSAQGVSITTDLDWICTDIDGDQVYFTCWLSKGDMTFTDSERIKIDATGSDADPGTLDYNSHYYWKVRSDDHKSGGIVETPIWDFYTIATGSLQVTIIPHAAVDAGARWIFNGVEYGSGQVVPNIPVGNYQLSFKDIAGFAEPASHNIEIVQGTNTESETYDRIYSGGIGIENNPFVISSATDLLAMRDNPASLNSHFTLSNDIDLRGHIFTTSVIGPVFGGNFDGQGHRIGDLTINGFGHSTIGLIEFVRPGGKIKNLGLERCSVGGNDTVGGLVGWLENGEISGCYVVGDIRASDMIVGGIAGISWNGNITNCYSSGTISAIYHAGGIVGGNEGWISNCYTSADVSGDSSGGLIGCQSSGGLLNCFWDTEKQDTGTFESIGINLGGWVDNVAGLDTNDMQAHSIYADAGWDFTTPVWKICDGTNYPKLAWQKSIVGDFVCPDGVDLRDYARLAADWMSEKSPYDVAPENGDGTVNFLDWAVFASNWDGDMNYLSDFASQWLTSGASCDIAPEPNGDGVVDILDLAMFAENWLISDEMQATDGIAWVSINNDPGVLGHEGFNGQMSKYLITNDQYCQFLNAAKASNQITVYIDNRVYAASDAGHSQPYFSTEGASSYSQITYSGGVFSVRSRDGYSMASHPVVCVSWYGATAFCDYYGYRLPTEWEWQAVADYDGTYTYGCGTSIDPSKANYESNNPLGLTSYPYTSPVDYYPASGYGICDMAGNTWVWTSSIYEDARVIRGSRWDFSANSCTVSYWGYGTPNCTYDGNGSEYFASISFRVCR